MNSSPGSNNAPSIGTGRTLYRYSLSDKLIETAGSTSSGRFLIISEK